ncbi:hypothetical protein GWO43_14160 [candidate division KSB1 bacterium]|nr:hypothetical protein [candidate division KSB1 bacterium]NIR72403.1 hypothetical protein [candidate division KSB1 bacterium]NIS25068.1 hypothetical protein [candidate division KSB1 bacterium]NIT71987.1 hypothetical protein [candidate division KSB1 bacterium]NIU25745.1 hypothetical protein [candidate division KSB1 bacterium]
MDCKKFENKISAYLDETLSDTEREAFEKHIETCAKCSSETAKLGLILSEASSFERVEAPESLWKGIESELDAAPASFVDKLSSKVSGWKQNIDSTFRLPAPVYQLAGVAAILLIGILVGRYFFPSTNGDELAQRNLPAHKVRMVTSRTDHFVEKSKVLFLGIVNADSGYVENSNWQTEKSMAFRLIEEASFLKDHLGEMKNERLKLLVEELEMILLEIANMEEQHDVENIELIKSGIDRKGLLLKIHLYDLNENHIAQHDRQMDVL